MPLRIHDRKLGEVSLERLAGLNRCRDALLERTKAVVATILGTEPSAWTQMRNGGLIRLMGEEGAPPEVIEAWKQDNDRYLRIERMVADRLRRHYDWKYHNWAKDVAARHRTVCVEKANLRQMWKVERVNTNPALKASAEWRKLAACGLLLAAVKCAVGKACGEFVEVEAAHTTNICSICGAHFHAAAAL